MTDFPTSVEIEFRDGKRLVPEYLASMMAGLVTHRMTYEEAVEAANKRAMSDFLNAEQDRIIETHFKEMK